MTESSATPAWAGRLRDIADFPKPGILFKDITPVLADASAFAGAITAMAQPWRHVPIDAVVGVEARGFILGAALARELGVGFVPVRKPGKLPGATLSLDYGLEYGRDRLEIHVDAMRTGARVIVVDDVLATGGTLKAAVQLVERQGAMVVGTGVLVENALFATLDPTIRKSKTPDGREFTLADTVGFVRNLPHQLVEAFRSTLEEIAESDLVVHVVDASNPDPAGQIQTVRDVIGEVGARSIPELIVYNKIDLVDQTQRMALRGLEPESVEISTRTGEGIGELVARIAALLPQPDISVCVLVPYQRGDLVSRMHLNGRITELEYRDTGTFIRAMVKPELAAELAEFFVAAD